MKTIMTYLMLTFLMLTVCVQAQTSGSFTNVNALDLTSTWYLNQNTSNGGSFIDADGNYVLAKSKGSDDSIINTAIVNGFEYENILNDTSGNESGCQDAIISNSNLVVWGSVNATCCSFEIALQVYNKNMFPDALLGGTAPPSISPNVSLTLNPNATLGRIADVIHKGNYLYIMVKGYGASFDYSSSGSFGTHTGTIVQGGETGLLKFNLSTGSIDATYYSSNFVIGNRGSLTLVDQVNQLKVIVQESVDTARIDTWDLDLNLVDSSNSFYYQPTNVNAPTFLKRPLLVEYPPNTEPEDGLAGDLISLVACIDPNDDTDVIRKLVSSGAEEAFNDETTIGSMYAPLVPHAMVSTDEHYVLLKYTNNGECWLTFINKETGSFDYHQSLMLKNSSGNLVPGLDAEAMVYDPVDQELDLVGTYYGNNVSLGSTSLPNSAGRRGIIFSYKLGVNPEAEVDLSVVGYPSAIDSLEILCLIPT